MLSLRLFLCAVMLMLGGCATPPQTKTPPTYGSLSYGFDRTNWNVICRDYPVKEGQTISASVADALQAEGWLELGKPNPAAYAVNATCRRLGYPPTRPETCPAKS